MATLPYEQRVTLNDASKAYYGGGQPASQGVTLHDAYKAAYPHFSFFDWALGVDRMDPADRERTKSYYREAPYDALPLPDTVNNAIKWASGKLFKADPNVPPMDPRAIPIDSRIPSYIPQDQIDIDSRIPSHLPQYNPHAEIPYLIAESPESPYYKVDAYNRPVLRPTIPSDEEIVNDIIRNNKYGTGATRRQNLLNLGLTNDDYERIRGLVNARMYANRAAVRPRVAAPAPAPAPQPQQRRYYQGMPFNNGDISVEDIM